MSTFITAENRKLLAIAAVVVTAALFAGLVALADPLDAEEEASAPDDISQDHQLPGDSGNITIVAVMALAISVLLPCVLFIDKKYGNKG